MYNRVSFPGQRGRGDGRHQPSRSRPHEPHCLLLTDREPPQETHVQNIDTKKYQPNDSCKNKLSYINTSSSIRILDRENKTLEDACIVKPFENKSECDNEKKYNAPPKDYVDKVHSSVDFSSPVEATNDVLLPGSTIKNQPLKYTIPTARSGPHTHTDALNSVGIPVYKNSLSHNYLLTNPLAHPLSPSTHPTMVMSHHGHPSHTIVFENHSMLSGNYSKQQHVVLINNGKRTKHLKPPVSNKLRSKPVTMNQISPTNYSVQSSSQSSLFHPASNYALPATQQMIMSHQHASQQQQMSISPVIQSQRSQMIRSDQINQRDPLYLIPPSAPLHEEDPPPLCSNGLPPAYATIDPKKLRTRHGRPAVFKKRGLGNREYQLL